MILTIDLERVKAKSGLSGPEIDAAAAALIAELGPAIEASIDLAHLSSGDGTGNRAVIELAATEIVAGELLEQTWREPGALDRVRIGPLAVEPPPVEVLRGLLGLRERGWSRLAPYLRSGPTSAPSRVLADAGRAVCLGEVG
ncbi:MAG: hypothetical protein SNJ74_04695 [Fimbriimonadaceae bacterium]